jgi:hypothetical protein
MFEKADLISRYTRAAAIRDGVLIDATPTARQVGFRYPVALTRAAWERCIAVPPGVACQDESGRLWGVVYLLRRAIGKSDGGAEVRFGVYVRNDNREGTPPLVLLKAVCGPGGPGVQEEVTAHGAAFRQGRTGGGRGCGRPARPR